MKVLLTGASGFFGSHAARALLRRGDKVYAFHRETTEFWRLKAEFDRIHWFNLPQGGLRAPFETAGQIDAVIHAAAFYGRNGESSSEVAKINTLFPLELLETALAYKCPLFLNMDTYFHKDQQPLNYVTNYSVSKKHFVDWAKCFAILADIRIVNLKLEHLFGPDDHRAKFTTSIADACLRNEPAIDLTPAEQKRDFIFIDDAISAMLTIIQGERGTSGFEAHEVGAGIATSIREFVEAVREAARSKTQLRFGAIPYRKGEIMHSVADNESLRQLGWMPRIDWRQGVDLLLKSMAREEPQGGTQELSGPNKHG